MNLFEAGYHILKSENMYIFLHYGKHNQLGEKITSKTKQ